MLFLKQQGASDEDICQLPKYKYRRVGGSDGAKLNGGVITKLGSDPPIEHTLSSENAVLLLKLLISVKEKKLK